MPRKLAEEHLIKKISVPVRLAAQVDLLLVDPLTGKVAYGAWQTLVVALVTKHLKEQAGAEQCQ